MHLQGWHLVIIVVLFILLFAGPKLPKLARSLGQSMRIFKSEVKQMKDDDRDGESRRDDAAGSAAADEQRHGSADAPLNGRIVEGDPRQTRQ